MYVYIAQSTLWATTSVYFRKKGMKEDTQGKSDRKLRIKGTTGCQVCLENGH